MCYDWKLKHLKHNYVQYSRYTPSHRIILGFSLEYDFSRHYYTYEHTPRRIDQFLRWLTKKKKQEATTIGGFMIFHIGIDQNNNEQTWKLFNYQQQSIRE
ncbi:unnamed protein product [Didymodactylos carnosus]|uniref:Uncharacterized protein n=1 Tax=Didymodactylos carnosus TaxID=1234261 RepID=A0A814J9D9_9BILA|nr:unnamed protein product [Didymodactylos carnosus]CAF1034393.1 unnamed protein product [Didymodactylos carnosus]CAF3620841.1 unnamed protein product [Didymodactylos carnosus]CAF3805042.1 unnamed protein product [Didymodactylos carnosus]